MAVTVTPIPGKIKGDGGAYARIPRMTHKRLMEMSKRTGYTIGELIAMAVAELSVVTKSEQCAD